MMETKDLILKKPVFEDWRDIYYNLWRHGESARYMLWRVTESEEEALTRMERTLAHMEKNQAWFVYEKTSGQAIGFAGIVEISPGVWEDTGIAVGPEFTGRGYGKQILNALVEYCREELGAEKFVCSCRSGNAASRWMQLACGFRYTHSENRTDPRTGEPYILEFYEKSTR